MVSSNVNSNTVFNTVKSIFSVLYPLITFPYIARILMTDNVGKINYGNSIVSYFLLIASLGITTYAVRECSKVRDNKAQLEKMASQIFSINLLSTFVAYSGLTILLLFAKPLENYRLLICIQSSVILFTTIGADWLNTAMEDYKFIAIRTVLMQIFSLMLIFIFVRGPEDYIVYAIIVVVAASGANIANIFYRRKYCRIAFTLNFDIKKHLPRILFLFSLVLSQTVYVNSDMTILGLIKGDHEVGLYSIAVKIYQIVNTTIASIVWVVMPKLSYFFAKKNYYEINNLLKYSLNFILVLGFPTVCFIIVLAPHLIFLIAGEAYIAATLSLRILGIALLCSFIGGWIGNMTMLPAGRENVCLKISIICALINIIFNLIMIPRWGLNAAAFTTALSELFGLICGAFFLDKNIKIKGLNKIVFGPLIGGIGIAILGITFQNSLKYTWQILLASAICSLLWYITVLSVTRNEFFFGFITPIINRLKRRR